VNHGDHGEPRRTAGKEDVILKKVLEFMSSSFLRAAPCAPWLKNLFGLLLRKIRISVVERFQTMLDLNKKLHSASVPSEKTMLQRQIDATDRQIDKLVYDLYGLIPEEIKIVEESTAAR